MKKALCLMVGLLLIACDNSSPEISKHEMSNEDKIKQHLIESGFSVRTIEFQDDKVILGKDAFFLKSDLLNDIEKAKDSREKHYSTNYLMSAENAANVRVKFDRRLKSEWKDHFRFAFDRWNEISGSSLNVVEVTSGDYDIYINMGSLPRGVIASASFPTADGKVGPTITVGRSKLGLSTSQKRFAATHELGHCFGFRHTNWFDRNSDGNATTNDNEGVGSVGANHIPGTPTGLDPNSVMNAIVQDWLGFSQYDEVATSYLYPN